MVRISQELLQMRRLSGGVGLSGRGLASAYKEGLEFCPKYQEKQIHLRKKHLQKTIQPLAVLIHPAVSQLWFLPPQSGLFPEGGSQCSYPQSLVASGKWKVHQAPAILRARG